MNIEQNIKDRIEARLLETKTPCKFYVHSYTAHRIAKKVAAQAAEHFDCDRSANYVVVYIESVHKFVIAFDINELVNRPDAKGGYVGIFAAAGHYSY